MMFFKFNVVLFIKIYLKVISIIYVIEIYNKIIKFVLVILF